MDIVKFIACFLVVAGHFFQSMILAHILPENDLYLWFEQTIYTFHVPLFFICSGYLYQNYSRVRTFHEWKTHIFKKAVMLGIPYFTFSFTTLLLKNVFSGYVNHQAGNFFDTLFVHPQSPYWYLYTLFFVFLITPTLSNSLELFILAGVSTVAKSMIIAFSHSVEIYVLSSVCQNEFWFVWGMAISLTATSKLENTARKAGTVFAIIFLTGSFFSYVFDVYTAWIGWILGIAACLSVLMITCSIREKSNGFCSGFVARYAMPIFLMHTIFASSLRSILFRIGISNATVHIALGLIATFVGPIIAAEIMRKTHMEFLFNSSVLLKNKRF